MVPILPAKPCSWRTRLPRPTAAPFDWLREEGSLTARLRAGCTHFSVRVLHQHRHPLQPDERALLAIAANEWAWVRDVLLETDGQPVVFAHSVLAHRHARGPWQMFSSMGSHSLGATLFSDPRITRHPLHYRRLDTRHALYRAAIRAARLNAHAVPHLWARRSIFTRSGHPLLVCEVFLPAILVR